MMEPIHHYGYDRFAWKGLKLFFECERMVELIPHEVYEKHYHLKFCWRDEQTPEFFNIFNARENSMRIALYRLNYDTWETPLAASLVSLNAK